MTYQPPVHIPGWGALLPDGRHVPEEAIQTAVDVITAACAYIESLPLEVRVQLSLEDAFAELDLP